MRYAVVIEKADTNYSAYVPDLPECVVTGDTVGAVEREMQHAIRFHLEGMREDGVVPRSPRVWWTTLRAESGSLGLKSTIVGRSLPHGSSRLCGKPQRPARESSRVEVAGAADGLVVQLRREPVLGRLGHEAAARRLAAWPPFGMASARVRPTSLPLLFGARCRIVAIVWPMSALLVGTSSTKPCLKSGPMAAWKFQVSARLKRAVHALALLQVGIGDLDRAQRRLGAAGREGPEVDHDRRHRRERGAPEVDAASGSVPGKAPSDSSTNRPLT